MPDTVAALHRAADAAERAENAGQAVAAAWSALHVDRDAMRPAFQAWSVHERGHDRDIPTLGELLRRTHRTPSAVAGSLRAAAVQQRGEDADA